jgi:small-conductance mechanosensitive channel
MEPGELEKYVEKPEENKEGEALGDKKEQEKEKQVGKRQEQLAEWAEEVGKLVARAEKVPGDLRAEYDKQVEDLKQRRKLLEGRLKELRAAGPQAWEDVKRGFDQAAEEMRRSLSNAFSRFGKK